MRALAIEALDAKIAEAQDEVYELQAAGKPLPRRLLINSGMKFDDPAGEFELNDVDLEKIHARVVASWGAESEPEPGRETDPTCSACGRARETQDPRIHLRILEEVERARREVADRPSKSDGQVGAGGGQAPEDAPGQA